MTVTPADLRPQPGQAPPPVAGELVAICGLCGGAGASMLAYLVARHAARNAADPVLVCDTGGPTGGLAAYAGTESPRSLPAVANAVAAHESLPDGLFADGGNGLRVMASRPRLDPPIENGGLVRVLGDARDAHRLTVVDCGTPGSEASAQILEAATQVVWVLPAAAGAIRRGSRLLQLFGMEAARRELVVARHHPGGGRPPMKELAALAATRNAALVLMPHLPDLTERPAKEALEAAALALDAIRIAIRR